MLLLAAATIVLVSAVRARAKRLKTEVPEAVYVCGIIDPNTIRTREDVVKAFDSLSVVKCGTDAVNWNHRQIAIEMVGKHPERRDAVDGLAGLYEKARYAPAHDPFTDVDVADARDRLTQVAGASE